jgi:hypothetical protein
MRERKPSVSHVVLRMATGSVQVARRIVRKGERAGKDTGANRGVSGWVVETVPAPSPKHVQEQSFERVTRGKPRR